MLIVQKDTVDAEYLYKESRLSTCLPAADLIDQQRDFVAR